MPELLDHGQFFGATMLRRDVGGCVLSEARYQPSTALPCHAHASAYFCLVTNGLYEEISGKQRAECYAGMIVFHPAEEDHAERFGEGGGCCFNVQLEPRLAGRLRDAGELPASRVAISGSRVALSVASLHESARADDLLAALVVEEVVLDVVAALQPFAPPQGGRSPPPCLARAIDHLVADRAPRIADVAALEGVHPVYFARAFRAHYGMRPSAYIRRLRLERACALMARTEAALSAVAHDAGYSDQSHFCREFRRAMGVPPSRYRQIFRR